MDYSNKVWWAQLGSVDSSPHRRVAKKTESLCHYNGHTMHTETAKTINQTQLIAILSWSVFASINHIYNELQGLLQMLMMQNKPRWTYHNKQIILLCLVLGRWTAWEQQFIEFRFKLQTIQINNAMTTNLIIWLHRLVRQIQDLHLVHVNT